MRCFAEVGEKLDILEKQEESPDLLTAWKKPSTTTTEPEKASETDYDAFVKDIPVASSEELDPVTKVAQWQQNKAPIQQGTVVFLFKEDFRCKEDFCCSQILVHRIFDLTRPT